MTFELNEHVSYYDCANKEWRKNFGKVVGSATLVSEGQIVNLVLVELTKSVTSVVDSETDFRLRHSYLAIDPDSLRACVDY